ncbi:MAG: helix-turn-helix transcriptional regulator [Acidaminococcaceae bacterium]|nr:helix-turn-helix transcriptional regulator [Acidaminococcaceae bacterium]
MNIQKLKAMIAKKQLRIEELATAAGVGSDLIYKVLAGKRKPTLATIGKLAAALDVEPEELLKED